MADKRLIDNESSTTVDKFYGNKGGKDVQIPLADAAAVLAGSHKTTLKTTGNKVTIDMSQFNQGLVVVGYGGADNAGRKGIAQIVTEGKNPTINWIIKPYLWDDFFSNEKIEGNTFSVDCSIDWYYFMMYPL